MAMASGKGGQKEKNMVMIIVGSCLAVLCLVIVVFAVLLSRGSSSTSDDGEDDGAVTTYSSGGAKSARDPRVAKAWGELRSRYRKIAKAPTAEKLGPLLKSLENFKAANPHYASQCDPLIETATRTLELYEEEEEEEEEGGAEGDPGDFE